MAGYGSPGEWTVARAVAASACFPPLFDPMNAHARPQALTGGSSPEGPERDAAIRGLRLSDGGLYDNLGLEPVWKDHAVPASVVPAQKALVAFVGQPPHLVVHGLMR
jgi:NTE family protein